MSPPQGLRPVPISADLVRRLQAGRERLARADLPGAADIAQGLLRQNASFPEAWLLLCSALIRMGSTDDDRALADALAAIPVTHPLHSALAAERSRVLARRGRFNEAVDLARLLEAHIRLSPRQHEVLSSTYILSGLFEDGLRHASIAVTGLGFDRAASYNQALALRYLGKLDEAVAAFEKIIRAAPDFALAYFSLADCRRWTSEHNHIADLEQASKRPNIGRDDRAKLLYALYKEYNDTGQHDRAWKALSEGAEILNALSPYDLAERTAYTEALIARFSGNLATPPGEAGGPVPIFIIGLPRSGTTLVERIFSAHPDVTDMGETHGFSLAIRDGARLSRFGELDTQCLKAMDSLDWQEVAKLYLRSLDYRRPATRFFTEKLPHNYHLVGPMRLAFPQARIVHVRRGPMDSLFGAYKVLFGEGSYLWSYRMEDLVAAYRLYRQITDHWRRELGTGFIEVTLEALIADPETEIRALLDRTGLSFHADCLSPHMARGGVSTASSAQVRQPINSQGVGAWRRHAAELEPMRRMLEEEGFVDALGNPIW